MHWSKIFEEYVCSIYHNRNIVLHWTLDSSDCSHANGIVGIWRVVVFTRMVRHYHIMKWKPRALVGICHLVIEYVPHYLPFGNWNVSKFQPYMHCILFASFSVCIFSYLARLPDMMWFLKGLACFQDDQSNYQELTCFSVTCYFIFLFVKHIYAILWNL